MKSKKYVCGDCENFNSEKDFSSEKESNCDIGGQISFGKNDSILECPYFKLKKYQSKSQSQIRQFETGATRDTDTDKLDYEGFLSPIVLQRYAQYLNKHQVQSDGNLRDSDNWQRGIPIKEYMKSKIRHCVASWLLHRDFPAFDEKGNEIDLEESLCAELFNTMGYLFEILKKKQNWRENESLP